MAVTIPIIAVEGSYQEVEGEIMEEDLFVVEEDITTTEMEMVDVAAAMSVVDLVEDVEEVGGITCMIMDVGVIVVVGGG